METKRCKLRLVSMDDIEDLYNILIKDEVVSNLNMDKPKTLNDIKKLIEKYEEEYKKETYEPLAIIDKETNKFIGIFLLKLDLYNEDAYECTTYIDTPYWNKGIVTEVMNYMVGYFFNKYQINNFRGYVMEKNGASAKVLQKCHFKLEKIFKVDGIEGNILSYLMTRLDYLSLNNKAD